MLLPLYSLKAFSALWAKSNDFNLAFSRYVFKVLANKATTGLEELIAGVNHISIKGISSSFNIFVIA